MMTGTSLTFVPSSKSFLNPLSHPDFLDKTVNEDQNIFGMNDDTKCTCIKEHEEREATPG